MLLPLSNTPRDYAWGSRSAIAAFEGRAPSGAPEAEVWFGDHPASPALVGDGSDRTLDAWIRDEGAAHGIEGPLSFLVKILAAGSPLSIQAHPSIAQAEEGFAREDASGIDRAAPERNYTDRNHKPEVLLALSDPFRALAGFRDVAATRALLGAIGGEGAAAIADRLEAEALPAVVAWLLRGEASVAVADLERAVAVAASRDDAPREVRVLAGIAAQYPGDPGIAVAALLNLVELRPGEVVFVPAGAPHAYVEGLGIEVMAASDNVLRGGLTPKHVDVAELVRVLDPRAGDPAVLTPDEAPGERVFTPAVPDFRIADIDGSGAVRTLEVDAPTIVVGVAGAAEIAQGDARVRLAPGAACLATPDGSPLRVDGGRVVAAWGPAATRRGE